MLISLAWAALMVVFTFSLPYSPVQIRVSLDQQETLNSLFRK